MNSVKKLIRNSIQNSVFLCFTSNQLENTVIERTFNKKNIIPGNNLRYKKKLAFLVISIEGF